MNAWYWCSCALLPPLAAATVCAGRSSVADRLAAIQLASSIATALLMSLSFAQRQGSSIDLALTLALLSLPATLAFALFEERWV
jgi:multisubunit Na+/H+ antiporter MnhF subunit